MFDPPLMVELLKLRACLVTSKGRQALKWGTFSYSNTKYSTVARQRTTVRVGFKLAVRGSDIEAGGLVAPQPCTAYLGKLAILFGCSLPCRLSPFVLV